MTTPTELAAAHEAAMTALTAFEDAKNLRDGAACVIAEQAVQGRPVHGHHVTTYVAARNAATSAMHAWVTASNAALAMGAEFEKGDAA